MEVISETPEYGSLKEVLNHLNLFGSSYLYAVVRIIDKYV